MHVIEQMQMERMYRAMKYLFCITLHQQEIDLVSLHILSVLEIHGAWLYATQSTE